MMKYSVYLLVSLTLMGAWVLGIEFIPGGISAVVVTLIAVSLLVLLLIHSPGS